MDLTQLLPGAVLLAIGLVVLFSELIKKLDKKNRMQGYRVYLPAGLSFGFAFLLRIGNFISEGQQWFYWAVIFAISVFFYEAILKKWRAAKQTVE